MHKVESWVNKSCFAECAIPKFLHCVTLALKLLWEYVYNKKCEQLLGVNCEMCWKIPEAWKQNEQIVAGGPIIMVVVHRVDSCSKWLQIYRRNSSIELKLMVPLWSLPALKFPDPGNKLAVTWVKAGPQRAWVFKMGIRLESPETLSGWKWQIR